MFLDLIYDTKIYLSLFYYALLYYKLDMIYPIVLTA